MRHPVSNRPEPPAPLGHAKIDRQHEQIELKLDVFINLTHGGDRRVEAITSLRDLLVDIGQHFGEEEAIMVESGFPESAHHLRQHLGMMTELALLLDRLEDPADTGALRQAAFVAGWYRRHVDLSDRKLVEWMGR